MQKLAREAEVAFDSVHRVTGHREPDGSEMDTDLMCATRLEQDANERMAIEQLDELERRHRVAWSGGVEGLALWIAAIAADRGFDSTAS